jgi:virulence factor Mce-like protein
MKVQHLGAKAAVLAGLAVIAVVILAFFFTVAGGTLPFSAHKYTVTVETTEAQVLVKHADVEAAGVKVGQVSDLSNDGSVQHIQLQLDKVITPLYRNATVLVRQKTLVGENYVDLTQGSPSAGEIPDGGTIPLSRTKLAVPIDDVYRTFNAPTRTAGTRTLRALGAGFAGTGNQTAQLLGTLPATLGSGESVMAALDQEHVPLATLVEQTGTVMQAIANRTADVRGLIVAAKSAATAVAARDAALEATFASLPGTLHQARESVGRLFTFAGNATPVIANLGVAMHDLKPVVADLTPTAQSTSALFRQLPTFITRAGPLLQGLQMFAGSAQSALPGITGLLRQLNPFLAYLAPYYKDIGSALSNFGTPGVYDRFGEIAQCGCAIGLHSFSNFTPQMLKALSPLLANPAVAKFQNTVNNPIRPPGQLPNATTPAAKQYPHIQAEK